MHIHLWAQPVDLRTFIGDFRKIASTEEAVVFLLKHWPMGARGQPLPGRQRVIVAIRNAASTDQARAIFIQACVHLGMDMTETY